MRETVVRSQDFSAWADAARRRWSDGRYARALRDRTVFADEGESFAGWEWLMPIVREEESVFDYLKDAVLVVDEPSSVKRILTRFTRRCRALRRTRMDGDIAIYLKSLPIA
jgi:hypothetical protein